MAPPLLTLKDIAISFGSRPLLDGADLNLLPGERACLVGRNGSGKSTLLKIAAGMIEPDAGERFAQPSARFLYLPQEADFTGYETVFDYVASAFAPSEEPHSAHRLLAELGLDEGADPTLLSGGEARKAAIARVLAPQPDALLLDEPTNHLDLPAIEWLENELAQTKSAILMISHDRRFLERLSRTTIWIDRGQARRLPRGFSEFEAWRDDLIEQEDLAAHKLDRKIAREESWMYDGGVTARRKRNVRRVDELHALRQQRASRRARAGSVNLDHALNEGELSGKLVLEAKGLSKSYGDDVIVRDFSIKVLRGDRIGLVGPNGAGKSTLIKLLTGQMEPDRGSLRLGTNLELVVLDQKREELNPDWTLKDALTGGRGDQVVINGRARHVASYMKDFLFEPEQGPSPISVLSGGERGRVMLARALAKPSNLLVLDEPTNDLDLETLDLLQEFLSDYAGTVLLVSHDRDFLDRVVTSVIAPEEYGLWIEYAGGYSDMVAQRKGRDVAHPRGGREEKKPGSSVGGPAAGTERRATGSTPAKRQTKLSYKDQRALDELPDLMETLQSRIDELTRELADAELFARDPDRFNAASQALQTAQSDLERAETQWLELEMKREEMASGA